MQVSTPRKAAHTESSMRLPPLVPATALEGVRLQAHSDASLARSASLLVQPGGKLRRLPGFQVGAIANTLQ